MRKTIVLALALLSFPALADYALILDGRVVQVAPKPFPVAKPLYWMNLVGETPKPQAGWTFDGINYVAPPSPPPIPSDAEAFAQRAASDPTIKAIVRGLSEQTGKSEQQVIQWLKGKL